MLKSLLVFMLLLPSVTFAETADDTTIRDVKTWSKTQDKDSTCADDYLKRRKQLGWRMALSPVTIAGSVVAGAITGAGAGSLIFGGAANADGWAKLGYVLGGGLLGTATGLGISATASTISTVNFFNNQRLLKAIYEGHTGIGDATEILHEKYSKAYPDDALPIQDFADKIRDLDSAGSLCDGSLVEPGRFKKGRKLKQRLATRNEIFQHIHKGI